MTETARERAHPRAGSLLIVLVVALTFGRVLGHEWLTWDDGPNVVSNDWLRPPSLASVARFWVEPFKGMYAPVAYSAWSGLTWLAEGGAGNAPGAPLDGLVFRVAQLGLHAACALLVLGLLRRIIRVESAAVVGALLFAVHPLQAEVVAWASELRGGLSAFFGLAALLTLLRWRDSGSTARGYALATLCFCLALLSKPNAVAIPLIALLLDRAIIRSSWRSALLALVPWVTLAGLVGVLTHIGQPVSEVEAGVSWTARPLIALDALGFYTAKLVWPLNLAPDAGRFPEWVVERGWKQGLWAIPLVLAAALALGRKRPLALLAAMVSLCALLPVLGFTPFDHQQISTVADRYFYVAMLGPALLLAAQVRARPALVTPTAAVLLVLALLGFGQAGKWSDTQTLFEHNLVVTPVSVRAHMQLGMLAEARHDLSAAAQHFDAILLEDPGFYKAYTSLGNLSYSRGDAQDARRLYRRALEHNPLSPRARVNLRRLEKRIEEWHSEGARVREVLADAEDARARRRLAQAHDFFGDHAQASHEYRAALTAKPEWAAVELELAWLLATTPDDAVFAPAEALALASGVVERRASGQALWTLALAQAATGDLPEALESARRASAAATRSENGELAARIDGWAQAVARGEVWRGLRRE